MQWLVRERKSLTRRSTGVAQRNTEEGAITVRANFMRQPLVGAVSLKGTFFFQEELWRLIRLWNGNQRGQREGSDTICGEEILFLLRGLQEEV